MEDADGAPEISEPLTDDRLDRMVREKAAQIRAAGLAPEDLEARLDARARAMGN